MAAPGQFLIQRVVRLAVDVFQSTPQGTAAFREGLSQLTQLVHQLTPQDLAFDPDWVRDRRPYNQDRNIMPMTYVRLCENESISIGIFILKNGFTLPMHDHPNMHGVLKVLHGQLQMLSFTPRRAPTPGILNGGDPAAPSQWDVRQTRLGTIYNTAKDLPRFMGPTDMPALLTPELGNIHQIAAVDGAGGVPRHPSAALRRERAYVPHLPRTGPWQTAPADQRRAELGGLAHPGAGQPVPLRFGKIPRTASG